MKLRRLEELPELVKGKKVVLANGCFDVLHVGHLRYLRAARELGDILVVAVNSDRSVRAIKDEGRPILTEQERVALVEALECVDFSVVFDEPDVSRGGHEIGRRFTWSLIHWASSRRAVTVSSGTRRKPAARRTPAVRSPTPTVAVSPPTTP